MRATNVQEGIIHDKYNDEDGKEDDNEAGDSSSKPDKEDNAELDLLHQKMDALEHHMYSKGTMASVFACAVTQARLASQAFGAEAVASITAIFEGRKNPDPCAVTAAVERGTAKAWAYLVVMNNELGFTLLHHL